MMIEKELKCCNHDDQKADIFILEKKVPYEKRFVCNECWQFCDRNIKNITFTQAKIHINQDLQATVKVIQNKTKYISTNLSQLYDQFKELQTQLNNQIGTIFDIIKEWQQSLETLEQSIINQNFESLLINLIETENLNTASLFINKFEQLQKNNISHYQKLNEKILSINYSSKIDDFQNTLLQCLKLDLTDQSYEDEELSQIIYKQSEKSFNIKALCKQHENKPILYIHKSDEQNLKLYCTTCRNREGKSLDEFVFEWKIYEKQTKDQKQAISNEMYKIINQKFISFQHLGINLYKLINIRKQQLTNILFDRISQEIQDFKQMNDCFYDCKIDQMISFFDQNITDKDQEIKDKLLSIGIDILNLKEDLKFMEFVDEKQNEKNSIKQNQQENQISIEIIQNLTDQQDKQQRCCYTISFNKDRSLMISGYDEKIHLWQFQDGKLNFIKELIGHSDKLTCLQFSKFTNNFISGSNDKRILLWKQVSEYEWEKIQADQDNLSEIYCFELNDKEDQLLSGGSDQSIKAWNLASNSISYRYSLQKHKDVIYGLSLNRSETYLISCSRDKKIIVWQKERNRLWTFKQFVQQTVDDFGYRLSFISDTEFIWIPKDSKEIICMFELKNHEFKENIDKSFQLLQQEKSSNMYYFPILYNKEKQIYVVKHKYYIFILRRQNNGRFVLSTEPISSSGDEYNFANITNDGEYLVIFRQRSNSFQTLKLNYK